METRSKERRPAIRGWLPFLGLLLAALIVAACGGGDDGAAALPADQAPAGDQVIRLRLPTEPPTLDPQLSSIDTEVSVLRQLFSGLFTYDADLNIVPDLATELPIAENGGISPDGMTYTVHLDPDAVWSDGQPLTAQDFVYSMKRALDPNLASPYAGFFYSLAGAMEYNTALGTPDAPLKPSDAELESLREAVGISAPDDQTLVFQLAQPTPSFLNLLALPTSFPVRRDVVEEHGASWTEAANHVGNGPFVLAEWQHNQRIVLEANQNWHRGVPTLARVEINVIADDAAAYAAYLADDLDVVNVPPPAMREVGTPGSPLAEQLMNVPDTSTFATFMNLAEPPFDDVNVRTAFARGLDREALVQGVLQGAAVPTTTWIPPGMPGYNPDLGSHLIFDPEAAAAALAAAGYENGEGFPTVTFLAVDSPMLRVVGEFVEDQYRKSLNITVRHEYVDGPTYGARFTSGDYQATIASWNADWPYPDNWLPTQFMSNSPNNVSRYSSTVFDQLMQRAAREPDDAKRLAIYEAGQRLILEDVVIAPLFNLTQPVLVKTWVKNFVPTGLDAAITGDLQLHAAYIAQH